MVENDKILFKKASNLLKVIYYMSITSIIIGVAISLITCFDQLGWGGIYLGIGTLYPFCVFQTGYIIWYKVGKAKLDIWNVAVGISSVIFTFCLINMTGTIAGMKHNNVVMIFRDISTELLITVAMLVAVLYLIRKSIGLRRTQHQ